jgi:hypothetical protein
MSQAMMASLPPSQGFSNFAEGEIKGAIVGEHGNNFSWKNKPNERHKET